MSIVAKTCKEFRRWLVPWYLFVCVMMFISCLHAAMLKKPVVTEVRTPTNTWSGLGFSKSMPAETIKELRRANHVSYKPSMSTTYEVPKNKPKQRWSVDAVAQPGLWCPLLFSQGSPLSLSRSSSREGIGNGSDSDNWRDRNGAGNGLSSHAEFPSAVSSPKRKQNKSGQSQCIIY